jgi:alkylation response protein AidB-like acyl-CoA dehydrogenase
VAHPDNPIGVGWAAPTLLAGGTPEQQQRWLPGIHDGSTFWCQLFSEPDAGSDLASLTTRAVRDGDVYVVNGQKIWSTWAYKSDWAILLARTNPDLPRHKGISYFVLDMTLPGVEVRPLREMTGQAHFSEVFLTDVRVPVDCRIGEEGDGWRLAGVTLANERESLSEGGLLWGMGPTTSEFFDLVRAEGGIDDPQHRQRAARIHTERLVNDLLTDEPSIRKTLADEHGQHVLALAKDRRGAHGMLGEQTHDAEERDVWHWGYLFSRALTIGGGTSEVQRNIIGEKLLGLPKEPT